MPRENLNKTHTQLMINICPYYHIEISKYSCTDCVLVEGGAHRKHKRN